MSNISSRLRRAALVAGALATALPAAALAFDPVTEGQNYSKIQEHQNIYLTPEYQLLLTQVSQANLQSALQAQSNDPERNFGGRDVCWNDGSGCAGDARLYDWGPDGYGLVKPVLFTARG